VVSEDYYMYGKKTTERIMFLTLYINNMLMAENNMEMIKTTKQAS